MDSTFSQQRRTATGPRIVLLHPSDLPEKSQLEKLLNDEPKSCIGRRMYAQSPWQEGELLWGKIKGFPYWPCMVSKDPFSQVFAKQYGQSKMYWTYHVQFFGASADRSWIREASLMPFEGREQFLDIVQYGLEDPRPGCKPVKDFQVSQVWFPMWSVAVAEAEQAWKLSCTDRLDQYKFKYVVIQGDEKIPLNHLLCAKKKQWGLSQNSSVAVEEDMDVENEGSTSFDCSEKRLEKICLTGETRQYRKEYDSDDFYSSDDNDSDDDADDKDGEIDTKSGNPYTVRVRSGQFEKYLAVHQETLQMKLPDWSPLEIKERLRQQWRMMSELARCKYVSRHKVATLEIRKVAPDRKIMEDEEDESIDPASLDLNITKLLLTSSQHALLTPGGDPSDPSDPPA